MVSDGPTSVEQSRFFAWTIRRPVATFVLFVALLVIGFMAYPRIPLQLAPSGISSGQVSVWIPVPDGTPPEVMDQIARPIEDLVRTIPGVRGVFSTSTATDCHVRVEYDPEIGQKSMGTDVRERVDRARVGWPEGVDRYFVFYGHLNSDLPVYIASVGLEVDDANDDVDELFRTVIESRLLAVEGVARVTFWGLVEKRATIGLDNDRVAAHAVPVRDLIERLRSDNQNVTCGKLLDGGREYLVRSIGKFNSFDEIRDYPISPSLRVRDVAEVDYRRALRNRLSRVDGLLARVVVVYKNSKANTIDVCDRIKEVLEDEVRRKIPASYPGVKRVSIRPFLDQGEVIRLSIESLKENGAWGGLFAMVVLFVFFRRVRLTILVTLAIPFSLLITVVWIHFRGGTFNILSIMGMSLGLGMLLDNSIVVVENVVRRMDAGATRRTAAIAGAMEVGLAVSLATLTTVVVFVPIMFMGDPRFKSIYQEIGLPLCVSVMASLLVALVFIPQGVIAFGGGGRRQRSGIPVSLVNRWTTSLVGLCLRHRFEAFMLFALLLSSVFFVVDRLKKSDAISEGSNRVAFRVTLPKNLSLREANDIFAQLESSLNKQRKDLGIRSITAWFDSRDGDFSVILVPGKRVRESEFFEKVKPYLGHIPDVRVRLRADIYSEEGWGERLRVFVHGSDYDDLVSIGEQVRQELGDKSRFPEITEVTQSREEARDEVRVTVDRELAQHYGINAGGVAGMVSWAIRGAMLPDYESADREVPFWIRFEDPDVSGGNYRFDDLPAIPIYRVDGQPVRLENVASWKVYEGPGAIRRVNGKTSIAYTVEVETEDVFALKQRVRRQLSKISLPRGYEISMEPRNGGFEYDIENLIFALTIAFMLVFFVMGFLFESIVLPFSVLFSMPHAFFGSLWALYLVGSPLDAGAMIGMVLLVGIVVNNAIVLVDAVNRFRNSGLDRDDAVLEAVRARLRPVWMTALTTIFGLLPLALFPQTGEGMDYQGMAIVLIGGLTTSTFFTLFVVPLFYVLLDDLRQAAIGLAHFSLRRP